MSDENNEYFEEEPAEDGEKTSSDEIEKAEERIPEDPKGSKDLLGVNEFELDIYSLIIAYGNATIGDLVLLSRGKSIEQIQTQIDRLKEKNMVVELPGLVPRYQAVPPFDRLAEEIRHVSERIQTMRDELKEQIREASTTVRDALIDMTQKNVDSVSALESDAEGAKTASLEGVSSKTETWTALKKAAQEKYDSEASDLLAKWNTSIEGTLEASTNELHQITDESGVRLKQSFDSVSTEAKELANLFQNELTSSLSVLETSAKTRIQQQSDAIVTQLDQEKESAKMKISDVDAKVTSSLNDINQSINSSLSTIAEEVTSAIGQGESQVSQLIDSIKTEIEGQYTTLEQEFETALSDKATAEEGYLQDHSAKLDQAYSAMRTRQDAASQNLVNILDETHSQLLTSAETTLQSATTKVDEIGSRSISFMDTTMKSMKNAATASIQSQHNSLKQYSSEVTQDTQSIMNSRKENMRNSLQQMLTNIQTVVTQEIESISQAIDDLSVKIESSYNGMLSAMDSSLVQSNQELDSKLNDLNQATTAAITQVSGDAKNVLNEFGAELQNAVQTSKDTVAQTTSEFKQSATSASESFVEAKSNLIQLTKDKSQQTSESLSSTISAIAADGQRKTGEQATIANNELRGSFRGTSERIVSQINSSQSSISDAMSTASHDTKTSLNESLVSFSVIVDDVKDGAINSLSSVSSIISNHKEESTNKIQEGTGSLISGLDAKMSKGSEEVDGTLANMRTKIDRTHNELTQSFSIARDDFRAKSSSLLINHLDVSGSELEGISSKIRQDIEESYNQLDGQLNSLKNTLTGTIEKLEESPMIGLTEDTLEKTFASPSGDEVDTHDIAERLSQVWDRVRAADFPGAKKTWNVVTRAAVNAHIRDMLTRAKSKVTLIVPEVGDVPTETLTELKTVVGVELVFTESGALGPNIKPLVGRGNIRVRSRSEKDVFACVRDSEEVLMAPAASIDSDVIGVVSEDDGFVKFVMSIVGPIFQAKTKLVKPEDL